MQNIVAFADPKEMFTLILLKIYWQKIEGRDADTLIQDFPTLEDGLASVKFLEACVESSHNGGGWISI